MGRRAKNKQGDPASLDTSKEELKTAQKKLGKRKAEQRQMKADGPPKKSQREEGTNKKGEEHTKAGKCGEKVGEGGKEGKVKVQQRSCGRTWTMMQT